MAASIRVNCRKKKKKEKNILANIHIRDGSNEFQLFIYILMSIMMYIHHVLLDMFFESICYTTNSQ